MKASIYSGLYLIGHADLVVSDETMGCLSGTFISTEEYYTVVQQKIWEFNSSSKPDYQKWKSLNFNVQLENGYFLSPSGGYTFDDIEELIDEPKRVDIAGVSKQVIKDFLQTEPPRPFVEEPWEVITIKQKLLFEKEVQIEISRPSRFLPSHTLSGYQCTAICKSVQNDDVLFSIYDNKSGEQFALVHLTFSGKPEENSLFPSTTIFDTFDTFKYTRMYPDKEAWEDWPKPTVVIAHLALFKLYPYALPHDYAREVVTSLKDFDSPLYDSN